MAKKKQFVTAAAAFAVAASAVAPAITADAASSTVRLSSDYVRGGNLDAALDKEYKGSEIYWYKSSIDLNKLGVFQTAKGFVKGKGIKVEKKLRVLNYAQEIKPESEFVFEQGVPVSGIRVQPVLFADGNEYAKPVSVAGFNTDKVGEFEGTLTYANRAYGVVTKTVKYKVVATEVEISNVSSSVDQAAEVLSVTADVKNLKDGEKVELVVYPGKDMSATPIKEEAMVKDGKLTVSKKLPAGMHSFQLVSGDVKTEVMNFTIEAPMVKEVKAINAKQLEVTFNKAVDASTLITDGTSVLKGLSIAGATGITYTASLSEDKKVLKVTANTSIDGKELIVNLAKETVKTVDGKFVESFLDRVVVKDTVAPSILGTEATTAQKVKVKFSEPMSSIPTPNFKYSDGTDVNVNIDVTQDASGEFVTLDLSNTDSKKSVVVEFIGAKDIAGNIISPNPSKVTVQKGDLDGIAPKVTMLDSLAPNKSVIQFSEVVYGLEATDFVGFTNVTDIKQDETDKTKYVFTHDALTGLKSVGLSASTVKDFSGETNAAFSKIVDYKADTIAPVLSSAKVARDSKDGVEYLTLSFNKDVKLLKDIVLTGTSRKDGVTDDKASITLPVAKLSSVDNSKSTYRIALTNITTANTEYKLSLPADVVSNVSDVKNAAQANVISFTSLGDVKTVVQSVATNGVVVDKTNNSTVTVEFAEAFDVASAEVASNYTIDGAVVKQAINKDPNKKIITLVLEENKTTFSGERNITVNGVKTASGVAMEKPFFGKLTLNENVAPKVVSAVLQQDLQTVVVTFDEALAPNATATDFEIYKGAETTALAEDATTPEVVEGKTVKIKLAAKTDSLDLKVKASKTLDLTDTLKNLVVFPEYIKVTAN
ncbi:Ig-like domain-containing protein [Exiguobacterium profundum]